VKSKLNIHPSEEVHHFSGYAKITDRRPSSHTDFVVPTNSHSHDILPYYFKGSWHHHSRVAKHVMKT